MVIVAIGTLAMLALTRDVGLDAVLFETVSAFATVGLSTGITADLPPLALLLLAALMNAGRVGPLTLFVALAAREHPRRHDLPEERSLIG